MIKSVQLFSQCKVENGLSVCFGIETEKATAIKFGKPDNAFDYFMTPDKMAH